MKKIIEMLEKADGKIGTVVVHDSGSAKRRKEAETLVRQAVAKLEGRPKWETPEQYKKRTGKAWPDSGAVYTICVKNHQEFWYPKSLGLVKKVGVPLKNVIIATEAGPPPDDWRPEAIKEKGDSE
jgi:hypothetical protein